MKVMHVKLFTLFTLLGMSSAVFGYNFSIRNATKKPLHVFVQVKEGPINPKFIEPLVRNMVIQPNQKHIFSFGGNNCLKSISVGETHIPIQVKTEEGYKVPESPLCQDTDGIIVVGADKQLIALFEK